MYGRLDSDLTAGFPLTLWVFVSACRPAAPPTFPRFARELAPQTIPHPEYPIVARYRLLSLTLPTPARTDDAIDPAPSPVRAAVASLLSGHPHITAVVSWEGGRPIGTWHRFSCGARS